MDKTNTTGARGLRTLRFISSWDDGDVKDGQLARLLKKYNLPAIFYIPNIHGLHPSGVVELSEMGFEIGGHTVTHPQDMKLLSVEEIEHEVFENKKYLQDLIGKEITKFCYPRGRYDDRVIEVLKKAGYESARTTEILKTSVSDPYREPATIHVYQRKEYGMDNWFDVAVQAVQSESCSKGFFHIWGHSWEIDRDDNWENLEKFFEFITNNFEIV